MASIASMVLALVFICVASADYYEELQAPASNRLSFPSFNGRTPGDRNGNKRFNSNGGARGRYPGTGPTSGIFGGSISGTSELVGSGSSTDERVGSGGNGFGAAGLASGVRDPITALGEAVGGGGVPGEDYPILFSVPITGFSCEGQLPGYYADASDEARCQVFHICQDRDRIDSFLCPNGTVFNQQYFVCDWWYNFDCSTAEEFYELNAEIGRVDDAAGGSNGFFDGNGFGSASTLQGSFSYPSDRNVIRGVPSTDYGVPGRSNNNRVGGRGNQNGGLIKGQRNTFGGDRFVSASEERGSFSELNGAPSRTYGTPKVNSDNFGAGSTQNVVSNGRRNGGFRGSNIQAPAGLYQTPAK